MRTLSKCGRIEEAIITDQIERAKIAFLLAEFEKGWNLSFLEQAKNIAERGNEFYKEVHNRVGDINEYLLSRECERGQGELVLV